MPDYVTRRHILRKLSGYVSRDEFEDDLHNGGSSPSVWDNPRHELFRHGPIPYCSGHIWQRNNPDHVVYVNTESFNDKLGMLIRMEVYNPDNNRYESVFPNYYSKTVSGLVEKTIELLHLKEF